MAFTRQGKIAKLERKIADAERALAQTPVGSVGDPLDDMHNETVRKVREVRLDRLQSRLHGLQPPWEGMKRIR